MFIGHYGVSLAIKRVNPRLSLGGLFLAVQLLDLLFFSFVLLGIEKLRIVPGFTEYNSYDLYFMPYSHSLAGALVWSVLMFGAIALARRAPMNAAWLMGLAVFSHFVLDVPMHTPDLPLLGPDSPRLGLGLWNHRWMALACELACVGGGLWLYLRATRPRGTRGRVAALTVSALLLGVTIATPFLPSSPDVKADAVQALLAYAALAGLAVWLDRSRTAENGRARGAAS